MLKVIEVCRRIEGHGDIKILIQNDEISLVNFEFKIYRDFEKILIGKKLLDLPKIVSRICGLCYASQAIASCKAIEDLYNIEVSEQVILLRRLIMASELIKSHSMNFFFQTLPDLLRLFDITQKTATAYDLINYNHQLTTNIYELIKIGVDINNLFGGRSIHLISLIPGGIIYSPSKKKILIAKKKFQKALLNLEWIIDKFIELFSHQQPPKEFDAPKLIYLGLSNYKNYDRYSGRLSLKEDNKNMVEFDKHNYFSFFGKEPDLRGIDFYFDNKNNVIVGPFSRHNFIDNHYKDEIQTYFEYFDKQWKNSILFANFIRLMEMYLESSKSLQILDDPNLNTKTEIPPLNSIKKLDGIGVIEAPRGILLHHYHLNNHNSIERAKLFVATEFNIPLINEMITDYARVLFEKTGDINLIKNNVQRIIRSFDPCISCTTH
ncbi:MAG: nickel-dependent hydrogenase large subunit [Promethearchaeota archaeon]|nr:MAG: nickel-dependent hydrogenase large subunit [Candidatus Lokiarchaeota archaeon]